MRHEGLKEFAASRELVWSVIDDPIQMAGLMPGVEGFELLDDRRWLGNVKVPLGLGGFRMNRFRATRGARSTGAPADRQSAGRERPRDPRGKGRRSARRSGHGSDTDSLNHEPSSHS